MNINETSAIFKELGHPARLTIIKEIIKFGEKGLTVGVLQKSLNIPSSTLSHHISSLLSIKLISQKRDGTSLFCIANYEMINHAISFLVEECCTVCAENEETP